jgi:glycosyltransferase involved in cell wall biosynthesis
MVIIESLANGVQVVASSVGGIPELLDGANGEAVENDATKMIAALNRILTSQSRQYVKVHAIETYNKHFTVDHMVKGYLQIYNNITER